MGTRYSGCIALLEGLVVVESGVHKRTVSITIVVIINSTIKMSGPTLKSGAKLAAKGNVDGLRQWLEQRTVHDGAGRARFGGKRRREEDVGERRKREGWMDGSQEAKGGKTVCVEMSACILRLREVNVQAVHDWARVMRPRVSAKRASPVRRTGLLLLLVCSQSPSRWPYASAVQRSTAAATQCCTWPLVTVTVPWWTCFCRSRASPHRRLTRVTRWDTRRCMRRRSAATRPVYASCWLLGQTSTSQSMVSATRATAGQKEARQADERGRGGVECRWSAAVQFPGSLHLAYANV